LEQEGKQKQTFQFAPMNFEHVIEIKTKKPSACIKKQHKSSSIMNEIWANHGNETSNSVWEVLRFRNIPDRGSCFCQKEHRKADGYSTKTLQNDPGRT